MSSIISFPTYVQSFITFATRYVSLITFIRTQQHNIWNTTHYPTSIPDDINGTKLMFYPILYFSHFFDFKSPIMLKTSLTCLSNLLLRSSSNSLLKLWIFWSRTLSWENMSFTFPVYYVKYALLSLIWMKLSFPRMTLHSIIWKNNKPS